jgi:hypothetical protein
MRDAGGDAVHLSFLCSLLVGVPLLQASENTGIKMTIRRVFAGNSSEQTIYVQGDRKRMEFRNYAGSEKQMAHNNGCPGRGSPPLRSATWDKFLS